MTSKARQRWPRLRGLAAAVTLAAASFHSSPGAEADPWAPLNPTGHAVVINTPLMDGKLYLGDLAVTIDTQDRISFSPDRLGFLLSGVVDEHVLQTLRTRWGAATRAGPDALAGAGIGLRYDPQTIAMVLTIPSTSRARKEIAVANLGRADFGDYEKPASFSAYLNLRGSASYVEQGTGRGFGAPVLFLDGATRFDDMVLESHGVWQPGGYGFQRQATRLVYDDRQDLVRWSIGDLQTMGSGFQSAPAIAGISLFRSYAALQPQLVARPTGRESFSLERPSTVEVYVNDHLTRRIHLDPGSYNLRDFPFVQGVNDVRLAVLDDAGRTRTLEFNFFFDQTQLAEGLSEFGLYAGVAAPAGLYGPDYSRQFQTTGFYRRGISDALTLGVNFQADRHTQMAGLGAGVAAPLGAFGIDIAGSNSNGAAGFATRITYQDRILGPDGTGHSLNLSAQYRGAQFAVLGNRPGFDPYAYEFGASYFYNFDAFLYAGLDLHYAKDRGFGSDLWTNRLVTGWQVTPATALSASVTFQRYPGLRHETTALMFSLTTRLDNDSSLRATYDGGYRTARLGYQTRHGDGAGSYNATADIENTGRRLGFNGAATYWASEAELGVDHNSTVDTAGKTIESRTNLHVGTSLAFADGALAVGRPIYDSFALVTQHKSLGGARVILDPTPYGYTAATGLIGTATEPDMMSYTEKNIVIDVPDAPPGFDLGKGAFRLRPPYRSGYRLQVGSEYSVTVVGRLLDRDNQPLALVQGAAAELTEPGRAPLELFTNRDGRFGVAGLRPGRWRIMMSDGLSYLLSVPAGATAAVKAGDLHPAKQDGAP